ncbi:hypothetical protein [Bacillus sp. FJAT-45350]|uniref:hypothetical protein n=1 Tax=Bacillus sp. FJAT-45350 TaxID=2011014 RepID=UPI00211C2BC8|nr:hypothetical protein [Bacillus sp. FJAT-45350]
MNNISQQSYMSILSFMEEVNHTEDDIQKMLTHFERILGYSQSILWRCDNKYNLQPICKLNIAQKPIDEYIKYYNKLDVYLNPRHNKHLNQKRNCVHRILDLIPKEEYEKLELYNDFFKKYHHYDIMTMYLYNKTSLNVGRGDGKGFNVNIPLPAGTGNAGYLYAFEKAVDPSLINFSQN